MTLQSSSSDTQGSVTRGFRSSARKQEGGGQCSPSGSSEVGTFDREPSFRARLFANGPAKLATAALVALVLIAIFGPFIVLSDPLQHHLASRLKPPGIRLPDGTLMLFGTDQFGRDLFARIVCGIQLPLLVASCAAIVGSGLGLIAGIFAGYYRNWPETIIGILIDIQLSLPFMLVALLVMALFGASVSNIVLVFSLLSWPIAARVAWTTTLSIRNAQYIEACLIAGGSNWRVIRRHILPSALPAVVIVATTQTAHFIIYEAALSFFGFGLPPPHPTWGNILADSRTYLAQAWWLAVIPGLCIGAVAMASNTIGNAMHEALQSRPDRSR